MEKDSEDGHSLYEKVKKSPSAEILKITARIIGWIFVFYLFLGFVVVPLASKWVIQSQGTKVLKHKVRVRAVGLNPILGTLNIRGFAIEDADKETMVGFDQLKTDVSLISLLKKPYRIESVSLDGLQVNAILSSSGHVNLIDLIPENSRTIEPTQDKIPEIEAAKEDSFPSKPLPLVVVNSIQLQKGSVRFTDQTLDSPFTALLNNINISVTGFSTDPQSQAKIIFQAKLNEKGTITTEALVKPLAEPLQLETEFTLSNYALPAVTPYAGKYTGRAVKDGKLDFKMNYRIADNKLTAGHKLLIQRFDFGNRIESKDALNLPFGLAVALLEDPQGRINISLPVRGDMSDPEFKYMHLVGQVIRDFFLKLVTKPFSVLASVLGSEEGTEELGYVRFLPGKTGLQDREKDKLSTLIRALKERPKLRLEINGSYDPEADWRAIKTDVLNRDHAQLSRESTRDESWVYQMLYQRRFGIRALWALSKKYKSKDGYDTAALNKAIKRELIEEGSPDKLALEALAQTRAKILYDFIIARGFDSRRVKLGVNRAAQSSLGEIPLELTLMVFEDPSLSQDTYPAEFPENN